MKDCDDDDDNNDNKRNKKDNKNKVAGSGAAVCFELVLLFFLWNTQFHCVLYVDC